MNEEILDLYSNIIMLEGLACLDDEFKEFAKHKDIKTIKELNELIEAEIDYWIQNLNY